MRKFHLTNSGLGLACLASALFLLTQNAQTQTTPAATKIEVLGTGNASLLLGPLTDPNNDGLDAIGGSTDPSWDWEEVTASIEPDFEGGENAFNVFDHKVDAGGNDKWCCDDPNDDVPVWVAVKFKQVISLTYFTITSGNDTPDRDPLNWAIQGSDDGNNWTDIFHQNSDSSLWGDVRFQVNKFTLPEPSLPYRWIRYICWYTSGSLHQISEIEYYGIIGGANQTDADKDGMPDDWEKKYGLNPSDPSDAAKDANGNGVTNLNEYKAGLDPLDTTRPAVVSARATSANLDTVALTFSKEMDPTSATNAANYSISPAIAVTAASYKSKVVTLTTAKQTAGAVPYTVTITNVKDVNNWPVPTEPKPVFYSYETVQTTLNYNLKAYWPFDGDLEDKVGIFDGSERGATPITYDSGKTGFGKALLLDGVDQYVLVTGGSPDDLSFAGGSVSISCWFKVGSFDKSWQALVAQGEGSSWRVARNSGDVGMSYAGGTGDITSAKDVSDGSWHHLVAISDGGGTAFATALYIDGVVESTATGKAALAKNGARTMIGENPGSTGRSWNGNIDDVAIWNRVLSQNEITTLYNGGNGKTVADAANTPTQVLVPAEGIITTQLPAPNAKNVSMVASVVVVHEDGKTPWTADHVSLQLNGVKISPTFTKVGNTATITYTPTVPYPSQSTQTVSLGYLDPGGKAATMDWSFEVTPYQGPDKDIMHGYEAFVVGKAAYTADKGGHTAKAGDRAIDFGKAGSAWVDILDVTALNTAAAKDEMSFSFWVYRYDINASSAFWANSVSAGRGFQGHTPWSDDTIYFDTMGCCDATTQRISASITGFSAYAPDDTWWNQWHQFVFSKKADQKNIYIDGQLFLNGSNSNPLKADFTEMSLGTDGIPGGNFMHGVIDDFAIFSTEINAANAAKLAGGSSPKDITGATLLALWDFNTVPVASPKLTAKITGGNLTISWDQAGFKLQSSSKVNTGWVDVTGVTGTSYSTAPAGEAQYYRMVK